MDPFIGEIRIFGFDYAPYDWAYCNGALLPVSQFTALYSIIGNIYGGNTSQFNVPKFSGRTVMGANSTYPLGYKTGAESVALTDDQMPPHTHSVNGETITTGIQVGTPGATVVPSNAITSAKAPLKLYSDLQAPLVNMSPMAVASTGNYQAHENRQPYLALNFCICTDGVYPNFN